MLSSGPLLFAGFGVGCPGGERPLQGAVADPMDLEVPLAHQQWLTGIRGSWPGACPEHHDPATARRVASALARWLRIR